MPKFDDILAEIGDFGRYQLKYFLLVCVVGIPVAYNMVGQVFYADKSTDHWCAEEELAAEYEACAELGVEKPTYLGCIHGLRNISIPYEVDEEGGTVYSKCTKIAAGEDGSLEEIECDQGWVYDRSEWQNTIISNFDLVCDRKSTPDIAQSFFFVGVLAGSFVFGSVSDIIGRYRTFYIALGFLAGFSLLNVFSPNFWFYIFARFFIAAANLGTVICAFVMGTELVGPSKRVYANVIVQCIFPVGLMLLSVSAYFIRDWRMIQLAIAVPTFLLFLAMPFVEESPRWLISKGRYKDAEKIIIHIAEFNKKGAELPADLAEKLQAAQECEANSTPGTVTVLDLMKQSNLRMSTLNLMYNWFINSLVYYGLSLSTSDLGSNVYLACFISGAVEIPAYLLGIPMMESRLGRRYSTSLLELLGGVACLLTIFLPLGTWKMAIAMIGKFAISASFSLIYIYTAEILPTPLRGIGVGVCSTASRIGGILCPLILILDDVWEPLPLIVFGTSAILGGLFVIRLPESRGKKLPETIEEGERFNTQPAYTVLASVVKVWSLISAANITFPMRDPGVYRLRRIDKPKKKRPNRAERRINYKDIPPVEDA